MPSGWTMLTTPRPATVPANTTRPAAAAVAFSPGRPARSTPRCPGSQGCGGGSNLLVTRTSASGQVYCEPAVTGAAVRDAAVAALVDLGATAVLDASSASTISHVMPFRLPPLAGHPSIDG